jgi:antitoxin Phd
MARYGRTKSGPAVQRNTSRLQRLERWKLEDAKARFSEVVRNAATRGPQLVTVRGKEAAVVLSPEEFERMLPAKQSKSFVEFLQGLHLREIPVTREPDTGRDIVL